tara:strand:+ start:71 stop:457 length:387 start_codon:yes stop_codon:yes gene_type:complete
MPVYVDNAQNRKLNRVGKTWGKEAKKSAPKKRPPPGKHYMPNGKLMKNSDMKKSNYSPSLMGGGSGAAYHKAQQKKQIKQILKANPYAIDGRTATDLPEGFVPIYKAGFDEEWNPVFPNMEPESEQGY